MADTIQIVCWALQHPCRLREGVPPDDPKSVLSAVSTVQQHAEYIRNPRGEFGLYGDICVTSVTHAFEKDRKLGRSYPSCGFLVSEKFSPLGGVDGLFGLCGGCPANTAVTKLGGCAGSIYQSPDSGETDRQLRDIIGRSGLSNQFSRVFAQTNPVWYGLWAQSPLSVEALQILRILIREMLIEDRQENVGDMYASRHSRHLKDLGDFLRAIEVAGQKSLAMHVALLPLGHTDLGWYTVFPHCPFCKAAADVARWQRKYPAQLHICRACGTQYSPAETSSQERYDFDFPDLRELLGQVAFEKFAHGYLVARGADPVTAREIVTLTEAREEERCRKWEAQQQQAALQERYVQTELYRDLVPQKNEHDTSFRFKAAEFSEILKRCGERKIKVLYMYHHSKDDDMYRSAQRSFEPLQLLSGWLKEGCNEWFGASFKVPPELLAEFEKKNPTQP